MKKLIDNFEKSLTRTFPGNEIAFGLAFVIPWAYIGIKAFLIKAPFTKFDWYLITVTPLLFLAISSFLQAKRRLNVFRATLSCILFTFFVIFESAFFPFRK